MGGKSENADTPDRSMATHVAHIQPESITIRPEDHELLRAALADWYDKTAFTDEHVMQVKTLFRKIFGLPEHQALAGSVLPDAIIMQPEGDSHVFYVLMRPEDPEDMGWEAKEVTSEGTFCWAKDIPFRTIMFLLSQSASGMTESGLEHPSVSGSDTENA